MATMTTEEMRAARESRKSQSDWDRVRRMVNNGIELAEDEDSPNVAALMRVDLEKRRPGRSVGQDNKVQVSIRYHREVLDYFN